MQDNEYKYGLYLPTNTAFTIEKKYEKEIPTAIYTKKERLTVNKLYDMCDGLIHVSERVRKREVQMEIGKKYLYINEEQVEFYSGFNYEYEELSKEQIIKDLSMLFYGIEPNLQSQSMVGSTSKRIEDDPNYYTGFYILNDNKNYTILKIKDTYRIYNGYKNYYPDWDKKEDLIFEGKINFEVYAISLEFNKLKQTILYNTKHSLKNGIKHFQDYYDIEEKLNTLIKNLLG
jgi:hypothetical protein